jgi:hypothetical protein
MTNALLGCELLNLGLSMEAVELVCKTLVQPSDMQTLQSTNKLWQRQLFFALVYDASD